MCCSGPNLDEDDDDYQGRGGASGRQANGRGDSDSKPKSAQQKAGEALLRRIIDSEFVEGSSYSFRLKTVCCDIAIDINYC